MHYVTMHYVTIRCTACVVTYGHEIARLSAFALGTGLDPCAAMKAPRVARSAPALPLELRFPCCVHPDAMTIRDHT